MDCAAERNSAAFRANCIGGGLARAIGQFSQAARYGFDRRLAARCGSIRTGNCPCCRDCRRHTTKISAIGPSRQTSAAGAATKKPTPAVGCQAKTGFACARPSGPASRNAAASDRGTGAIGNARSRAKSAPKPCAQ